MELSPRTHLIIPNKVQIRFDMLYECHSEMSKFNLFLCHRTRTFALTLASSEGRSRRLTPPGADDDEATDVSGVTDFTSTSPLLFMDA